MKFNIKDIRTEGLRISRLLDQAAVWQLLGQAEVKPVEQPQEPAQLQLELEALPAEPGILVRGSLRGHFHVSCGRCLQPARIVIEEPELTLTFLPARAAEKVGDDEELSLEDLDTYLHDGKEIDLEPVVREILVLAIPLAPLCREECLGICPSCGLDRNREACSCAEQPTAGTPWAEALKRLKQQQES